MSQQRAPRQQVQPEHGYALRAACRRLWHALQQQLSGQQEQLGHDMKMAESNSRIMYQELNDLKKEAAVAATKLSDEGRVIYPGGVPRCNVKLTMTDLPSFSSNSVPRDEGGY